MCVLAPLLYNGLLCLGEVSTKRALAAGSFRAAVSFFLNENYSPKSEWKRVTQSELLFSFTSFPSLTILFCILSFLSILICFRLLQVQHCLLAIHPCPLIRGPGLPHTHSIITPQSHSCLQSLHVHVGFGANKHLNHLNTLHVHIGNFHVPLNQTQTS